MKTKSKRQLKEHRAAYSTCRSRAPRALPFPEARFLTRKERRALAEYLTRLRDQFGDQVQHVILYGSKVRGDFDTESDIDLFVVFKELDPAHEDAMSRLALDLDLKHDVLLSDFLVDQKRFARMKEIQEPLYQNLMSEGIDLWIKIPKPSFASAMKKRKTISTGHASSTSKAAIAKQSVGRTM